MFSDVPAELVLIIQLNTQKFEYHFLVESKMEDLTFSDCNFPGYTTCFPIASRNP